MFSQYRVLLLFLSLLGSFVAGFFGHFLGSEGTAAGRNILLFSILLWGLIFLFRLSVFHLKKKWGVRLVVVLYISLLLVTSFLGSLIRIYVFSHVGLDFTSVFPLILAVGGGQALPLPSPSDPSSSSSFTEDSSEIGVLLEPYIVPNLSFESSLRSRIVRLEEEHTLFLLDKERGEYWAEIKTSLNQAPSQKEYNLILDFESRDLQIREKKDECYSLFLKVLSEHPDLLENAQYTSPTEAIFSYFENTREELETEDVLSPADTDKVEIRIYAKIVKDINQNGPQSYYIKKILGYFDKDGGF